MQIRGDVLSERLRERFTVVHASHAPEWATLRPRGDNEAAAANDDGDDNGGDGGDDDDDSDGDGGGKGATPDIFQYAGRLVSSSRAQRAARGGDALAVATAAAAAAGACSVRRLRDATRVESFTGPIRRYFCRAACEMNP